MSEIKRQIVFACGPEIVYGVPPGRVIAAGAIECEYCWTHNVYREAWPFCRSCGAAVKRTPKRRTNGVRLNNLTQAFVAGALSASDFAKVLSNA